MTHKGNVCRVVEMKALLHEMEETKGNGITETENKLLQKVLNSSKEWGDC